MTGSCTYAIDGEAGVMFYASKTEQRKAASRKRRKEIRSVLALIDSLGASQEVNAGW